MADRAHTEKDSNMKHREELATTSERSASPSSTTLCDDSQSDDDTHTDSDLGQDSEHYVFGAGSWVQGHCEMAGCDTAGEGTPSQHLLFKPALTTWHPAAGVYGHISDLDHQRTEVHPGQAKAGPGSEVLDASLPRNTRSGQEQLDSSSDELNDGGNDEPKA